MESSDYQRSVYAPSLFLYFPFYFLFLFLPFLLSMALSTVMKVQNSSVALSLIYAFFYYLIALGFIVLIAKVVSYRAIRPSAPNDLLLLLDGNLFSSKVMFARGLARAHLTFCLMAIFNVAAIYLYSLCGITKINLFEFPTELMARFGWSQFWGNLIYVLVSVGFTFRRYNDARRESGEGASILITRSFYVRACLILAILFFGVLAANLFLGVVDPESDLSSTQMYVAVGVFSAALLGLITVAVRIMSRTR
jgi:hypothetical protein